MKKLKYLFLIMIFTFLSISSVYASEVENFNSRITLGRFQNGENVQIGQNESRTNTLSMYCSTCGTSVYYPLWIGFYGNKSGDFTSDKIYNFSLTINYPVISEYYLFDWQRALRDATVASSFSGAEIDYCTLEENSKTRTTTTCQFTASGGSYYEFNYYFGNLTNIGYDIYGSFGSFEPGDITLELLLTSTTDYGGQLVEQNEVIIGQNQQIIHNGFETNDILKDDSVNGVENAFESFEGFISENSTITQLITMPITLYSSILNGLQSTCQPFALGNLFGTNLTIPCINIGNYLGTTLWSMIDIIISGFAIYSISKKLIKIFNNFSSMKEGDVIDD